MNSLITIPFLKTTSKYIFKETTIMFGFSTLFIACIFVMFQILSWAEYVVSRSISFYSFIQLVFYFFIMLIPAIIPVSFLFSALMVFSQLNNDSEIKAFKSLGYSNFQMAKPIIILSVFIASFTLLFNLYIGPWGSKSSEILISRLSRNKVIKGIQEGVFNEFFNLVVYSGKIDIDQNIMKDVFIYDDRDEKLPLTIFANEGRITVDEETRIILMKLFQGNIHQVNSEYKNYKKIDFETYQVSMTLPPLQEGSFRYLPSFNYDELLKKKSKSLPGSVEYFQILLDIHRRFALSISCFIFGLLGVGIGVYFKSHAKALSLLFSILITSTYWIAYLVASDMVSIGRLQPVIAMWGTNIIYFLFSIVLLKKVA